MDNRKNSSRKKPYNSKSVWDELSPSDWSALLAELAPTGNWAKKGRSLLGSSPYSGSADKTPSCYIVTDKRFVKCFSSGVYESDPIKFVSVLGNFSWSEAFNYLRKKFNIRSLPAKISEELQEAELDQNIKSIIASACNDALVYAAEALSQDPEDKTFRYAKPCLAYLKRRGIPSEEQYIRNLPIGVLPPLLLLKALVPNHFETCAKYLQNWLTSEYVGSLVLVTHETPTAVAGIKLRADFLRPDMRRDMVIVKTPGSKGSASRGFFGLNHFSPLLGRKKDNSGTEALIVEGEFDALANMVGQIRDGKPYDVVLAVCGSSNTDLDRLKEFAITKCLLVADSPDHGGDNITKNLLKENTLPLQVFSWPSRVISKDPFDAISAHGWDVWIEHLMERDPDGSKRKHFLYPHKWAIQKLREELSKVDLDDVRRVKEITAELGACLNIPVEQRTYISEAAALTSLSVSEINEIVVGKEESEEGYIRRILAGLKETYMFLGLDTKGTTGSRVSVWHKEKRELRDWNASRSQEMFGTLNTDLGGMVFWAREKVGIPDWMTYKRTARGVSPISLLEQETLQTRYMKMALDELMKELPTLDKLRELKAGCHYVPLEVSGDTKNHWCVVNGNDVYLGTPQENGSLGWNRLSGPRVGNYYFNLSRPKWSSELRSVSDLVSGNDCDIEETYDFLVATINKGWNFRHQYEDSEYLAAAMMINPVCSALPRQIYTMINGSRGSGKSSFLGLLTGSDPDLRLLEAAFGMDNYTVAGFRKEMNNCSLGAVLDEFEDTGNDSQSRHVREILRDVRALTSNPESRILRGNVESKEPTEYTLRCQLWCAAIQYLRDEADVSRFVQVHTELSEGHPNPKVTLQEMFSPEDFRKHRRTLSTGMFRHVTQLLANIKQLRAIYSTPDVMKALGEEVNADIPSRYLDGVLIPAALIQLVRRNPHDFIRRFIKAKAPYLKRIVQATNKHSLLDHILSAQIEYKRPNSETRHTTIRTLLSDTTERYLINETDCGVTYLEFQPKGSKSKYDRRWLIVTWSDALHGLLRSVPKYRYETPARLKQLADSDSAMTVPQHAIRQVPGGIRKFLKAGIRTSDYTAYDLSEMIEDWDTTEVL